MAHNRRIGFCKAFMDQCALCMQRSLEPVTLLTQVAIMKSSSAAIHSRTRHNCNIKTQMVHMSHCRMTVPAMHICLLCGCCSGASHHILPRHCGIVELDRCKEAVVEQAAAAALLPKVVRAAHLGPQALLTAPRGALPHPVVPVCCWPARARRTRAPSQHGMTLSLSLW